ncbi:MAG TPA: methylaspartate mutase subunit E [Roseovarius sp.]|nr:methylaspartate mutase subunit E [Roseovarius sp.]
MGSAIITDQDSEIRPPSQDKIPKDEFLKMRDENLARWSFGGDIDLDEAVAYHKAMVPEKHHAHVSRHAVATGACLTQPRGGFATLDMHKDLLQKLEVDGLADILPTTTDSYTRNERFGQAADGLTASEAKGRSLLNGFPLVNHGIDRIREIVDQVNRPIIALTGTAMPRMTGEIAYAGGMTGYLGSGIAYTTSYTKEFSIADGIRNYQYLDRLAALYLEKGVELHRRQPSFLTGTNVTPSIGIMVAVLDALLAAEQGVKHYGLELTQVMHPIQDAASIAACKDLVQEYLHRAGHKDVFTPVSSLHWMGAWPANRAQASAMVVYGGFIAKVGGAHNVTTKSTSEALGIPTPEYNAEGLVMSRMGIYLARDFNFEGHPEYQLEKEMIELEVRTILDKVLEMGDGDVAKGAAAAFEAGVMDVPWSPNRGCQSLIMPARDDKGYLRILDPGKMPFPKDTLRYHRDQLQQRADNKGITFGPDLAIDSVYELSEEMAKLMPYPVAS